MTHGCSVQYVDNYDSTHMVAKNKLSSFLDQVESEPNSSHELGQD